MWATTSPRNHYGMTPLVWTDNAEVREKSILTLFSKPRYSLNSLEHLLSLWVKICVALVYFTPAF
jgi:hypothetical protein